MAKQSIDSFSNEVVTILPHLIKGIFKKQRDIWGAGRLTMPQYLTLSLLAGGRLKMKDIARQLRISLPATTGLIDRLFKMNYVRRVHGRKDRRVVYIELTPQGKTVVAQLTAIRKKAIASVFSKLTEAERRQYLKILRKVMAVLYPRKK